MDNIEENSFSNREINVNDDGGGQDSISVHREVNASDQARIGMSEDLKINIVGPDREGIRTVDSSGRQTAHDKYPDGHIDISFTNFKGQVPQNEDDTVQACQYLVNRLNREGANWSPPVLVDGKSDVDCISTDGLKRLEMQVVRAETDRQFWKNLNTQENLEDNTSVDQAADKLKSAIDKKLRLSHDRRCKIVLVVNAMMTQQHAFPSVTTRFQEKYGDWLSKQGFNSVWIVGDSENIVRIG